MIRLGPIGAYVCLLFLGLCLFIPFAGSVWDIAISLTDHEKIWPWNYVVIVFSVWFSASIIFRARRMHAVKCSLDAG